VTSIKSVQFRAGFGYKSMLFSCFYLQKSFNLNFPHTRLRLYVAQSGVVN